MPQAEIDPPAQSHASYEARALPPSHHGWILRLDLFTCKIFWAASKNRIRHGQEVRKTETDSVENNKSVTINRRQSTLQNKVVLQ